MGEDIVSQEQVQKFISFFKGLAVLIVVVGIGWGVWSFWERSQEQKGKDAFALLFNAEKMEEQALREGEATSKDFFEVVKTWSPERQKEYLDALEEVTKRYQKTSAAMIAALKEGRFLVAQGKLQDAEAHYVSYLKTPASGSAKVFEGMMQDALGQVLEAQGKLDAAFKVYEEFSKMDGNPFQPVALMGKARIYLLQGKTVEAKSEYEKIMKDFSGTQYEQSARAYIGLMKL